MTSPLSLDAYFERIDYGGRTAVEPQTLHDLSAAHVQAIPFENIDILLRRPIEIEPQSIFDKLVTRRRGGYCFEHNGLMLEVLRQLGFDARPLGARVRLGADNRRQPVARTHMLIEVCLDGTRWLVDVGVGSASLTAALEWRADVIQYTPHEARRLQRENGLWYHQIRRRGRWQDVYECSARPMPFIDRKVANWYTSTHPDSTFYSRLSVALAFSDGERMTLLDGCLTRREASGIEHRFQLQDHSGLLTVLREEFGLDLPAETRLPIDIP